MGGSSSKQSQAIRRSKTSADLLRKLGGNIDEAPLDDDLEAEVEPQESEKTVHPQAEPLNLDLTTTVMLHVRCEMLPEAKPTFIVLYSRWAKDIEWVEIGMTELNPKNTLDPQFQKEFELEFRLEMSRQLRFEVYHAREHQPREYLDEHKFVGTVEVSLSDIIVCRANPTKDHGWYRNVLDNPLRFADTDSYTGGSPGILCAYAEEEKRNKWLVSWEMQASGISSLDRWKNFGRGSPDAYCVVKRCRYQALPSDEGSEDRLVPQLVQQAVYRTEVCRKSKNPAWQRLTLTPSSLCHMDAKQEVIIEVFDWYRLTEAEYIGEAAVSYETLEKHFADGKQLELSLFVVEGKREGRGILKRLRALSKSRTSSRSKSNTSSKRSQKRSRSPGHTRSPGRSPSPSPTTSKDPARTRQSRGRGATNSKGASEIPPAQSPVRAGGSSRAITQSPMRSPPSSMSPSKEMAVRSRVDALQTHNKSISKLSGVSQKSQRSQRSQRSIRTSSGSDSDSPKHSDSSQQLARFESGKFRRATTHSGGSGEASNTSRTLTNRRKPTNTSRAESLGPSISQKSLGQSSAGSKGSKAKKGKPVGKLAIVNPAQLRRYSFLDYVRSGLQLRLAMAVDFTRSNSKNEDLCHGSAGEIVNTTPYATAIRAIGKALSSYDSDDKILAYGFGAKIPPSHTLCSDCFALTGDYFEPEIDGVDQVLTAYQRALRIVHLHGPTRLAPVIDLINTFAEQFHNPLEMLRIDMVYHVFTIITDGQVSDELETINALVRSANLPVTVVIIGMGDEEHTYLQDLSQEVTRIRRLKAPLNMQHVVEQRQVVHYVPYHMYEDCPEELAAAALADIPREVVGYYKDLDIKPHRLELFEDYKGENVDMWLPAEVTEEAKSKSSRMSTRMATRMSTRAQTRAGSAVPSKEMGGSKSMLETSTSGFSVASGLTAYLGLPDGKEEPQKKKRKPPPMLFPLKDALVKKGMELGYAKHAVLRAVNEGLPSGTIDVLVDNVMYAGTGRSPPYRAAAKQALPDARPATSLPGQVDDRSVSRANSRIASPSPPRMGTELSKRDKLLHKGNKGSRGSSHLSASGSWEGEDLPTGTRRTSRQSQHSQESPPDSTDAHGRPRGITKEAELAAQALLGKDGGGSRATTKGDLFEGDELETPTVTLTRAATSSKELVTKGILSRKGSKLFDGKSMSTSKSVGFHTQVLAPPSPVAELPEQPPSLIERTETRLGTFSASLGGTPCSICLERPVDMQLHPCGHKLTCATCVPNLGSTCPLCQSSIKEVRPMEVT